MSWNAFVKHICKAQKDNTHIKLGKLLVRVKPSEHNILVCGYKK